VVLAQQTVAADQTQLPDWVVGETRNIVVLNRRGEHLAQERILGVTPTHPGNKATWYPERESESGRRGCTDSKSFGVEPDEIEQLAEIANHGGKMATPLARRPRINCGLHRRSFAASV